MQTEQRLLGLLSATLSDHDRECAARLVQSLLAAGAVISVHDGEETAVSECADAPTILAAMAATDEDVLTASNPGDRKRLGKFWLVWGNDPGDTIADDSANEFCGQHYDIAMEPWSRAK